MCDTPWLWNKGIAALCDHRLPEDFPDGHYHCHEDSKTRSQRDHYLTLATKINHGDLLWVRADWLDFFVHTILPQVNAGFVLITADTDLSIPSSMPEQAAILMNCPQVLHWYTQNYDGTVDSGFVSPLPIGMDFHTVQQRAFWGLPQMSVIDQLLKLEEIRDRLDNTLKRVPRVYADAAIRPRVDPIRMGSSNALTRSMLMRLLEGNPLVHEQAEFLPQHDMWRERGKFMFVLSHHGNGLDCHRIWEALVLGHVVVMQHSSLDPLFSHLPVIFVGDWSQLNQANLEKWQADYAAGSYDMARLTNQYWIDAMRNRAADCLGRKKFRT